MEQLTRLGLEKPNLTIFVMFGLIIMGLVAYKGFPKSEEPEITIRTAVVSVIAPGLSPTRIEALITEPVERKIRELAQVEDIESLIIAGKVTTRVTLYDQYNDLDQIWQELRDKMVEVARVLPSGALGPFVNTDFGDVAIASIALSAEGFSHAEREDSAKELKRRLYTVEGVAKVALHGIQAKRVWLEFDTERLAAVGLQLPVLIDDLRAQNVILPAGQLNAEGTAFRLEATGDLTAVRQIETLLTKLYGEDRFVQLADLLSVREGYADPPEVLAFYNGRPVIVLAVEMQSGFDILKVGCAIQQTVAAYERELPIGYALSLVTFQSREVDKSVTNALLNVFETLVVVILVVLIFLGLRTGLVIATIVPFAVLFALLGMRALGLSLEQVSIAAVIISLGLLVDNGVVVVEDVLRRVEGGDSPPAAALAAGRQFSVPLLIASATTIFAFTPFFLLEGPEGEYAFSLGAVITLALLGSWFSAMYILPLIASRSIKAKTPAESPATVQQAASSRARWTQRYQALLRKILPHGLWVLIATYLAVAVAITIFAFVPKQLFPASDRGEVLIYMDLPKDAHISRTADVGRRVSDWIAQADINPEVRDSLLYVGDGGPRFYLALDPADRAPTSGFILVNTANSDDADVFLARARAHLYTQFPEARFRVKRLAMGSKESGIVEFQLSGPNLDRLLVLARQVEDAAHKLPALVENQNDWGDKVVKVVINIDQSRARRLGVTSASLARILNAYFDGYPISEYREDDDSIPIVLRAMPKDRDSVSDIGNISVLGSAGQVVPLAQIASTEPTLDFSQLRRKNQQRTITVTVKSARLTAAELLLRLQPDLARLDLSAGYRVSIGGEIEDSEEIYEKLAGGLPVALFLMLLVIMYQFDSFARAAIVFLTIPLVIIGAALGLLVSGQPLSFMAILGLISLAGVIINNGIVLIDQIDIERRRKELTDSILTAAAQRLRPILLTSVTTVLGLVPLYLFGGPLWQPLAAVIIGGLSVASLLTLIFVPAAYAVLRPTSGLSDKQTRGTDS